jgi:polar amino acid transport system permease protein
MVTCIELTGEGKILVSMFFKYTEVFFIVEIVYLILVSIATWILNTVKKKLSIPGFESPRVLMTALALLWIFCPFYCFC